MKTRIYAAPAVKGLTTAPFRARILVQVTIYRRLRIGRDGHLDKSEATPSRPIQCLRYVVTCTKIRAPTPLVRENEMK